jgi:hypothetical protein
MVPPVGVLSGVPTISASEAHLRMVELGEIQCSSKVYALRWDQKPILLDLTPGQDDWVQLGREFDQRLLKRAETTNVKLLLELPSTTIQALNYVDTSMCVSSVATPSQVFSIRLWSTNKRRCW